MLPDPSFHRYHHRVLPIAFTIIIGVVTAVSSGNGLSSPVYNLKHHVIPATSSCRAVGLARRNELSTLKRRLMRVIFFTVQLFPFHTPTGQWYKNNGPSTFTLFPAMLIFSSHGQRISSHAIHVFHRKRPDRL